MGWFYIMKKNKIYVLGSVNMDLVISTDVIPKQGETVSGKDFFINSGGKGANQAVQAAKLLEDVKMIGAIGKDIYGASLKETLTSYGVDTKKVKELDDTNSGVAVITRYESDNRIIISAGANAYVSLDDVMKHLDGDKGDILVVQFEIPFKTTEYGLKKAKERGMITICNPAPYDDEVKKMFPYIDYLVVNQTEAELMSGIYPNTGDDVKRIYEFVKKKGVKHLLVSLGSKGASLIKDDVYYYSPAFKINAVDTTGAGDAFIGAFSRCLVNKIYGEEKLRFCNATSAIVCMHAGAQQSMPVLSEVLDFLNKYKDK